MFEKVKPFLDRLAAFDPWAWLFAFGLLLAVVLTVWVLWEIWQFVMRSQVARAYGFQVPRKVRVRPRRDDGYQGEFRLAYPYWQFAKRDGTRDRRRGDNNKLIQPKSTLALRNHHFSSRSPLAIYGTVQLAREVGQQIAWSDAEIAKGKIENRAARARQANASAALIAETYGKHPADFEQYCAELFCDFGYRAKVTPPSRDGGYDIELWGNGLHYLVECKCFAPGAAIGRPHLQKLLGANAVVGAEKLIFVTTARFTADARNYARELDIDLIDGTRLTKMVAEVAGHQPEPKAVGGAELSGEELLANYPADAFDR